MKPALAGDGFAVYLADCIEGMARIPENSMHAVVTDPPYLLGFMGRQWDTKAAHQQLEWHGAWAAQAFRVLRPGGHLLAFGGTRTWHRLAVAVEDAGFEIRDSIAWLYGSGFPKSLDISKAIDKANGRIGPAILELKAALRSAFDASGLTRAEIDARCGFRASNYLTLPAQDKRPDPWVSVLPTAQKWEVMRDVIGADSTLDGLFDAAEREVLGTRKVVPGVAFQSDGPSELDVTAPATPAAQQWAGWGTALKPAFEPLVVARKPLVGTVAANVLAHGVGGLNIDGCRIEHASEADRAESEGKNQHADFGTKPGRNEVYGDYSMVPVRNYDASAGRWPANVVLDEHTAAELDRQSGVSKSTGGSGDKSGKLARNVYGDYAGTTKGANAGGLGDEGGASRFFYQAKAGKAERPKVDGQSHPTIKPLALMRWLVRLVTPPGGYVLEPFAGSGTTIQAALTEGFKCIAFESEAAYIPHIRARLADAMLLPAPEDEETEEVSR